MPIAIKNYLHKHQLTIIYLLGVLLRIIVFIFQGPFNNDDHFGVVQYIHDNRSLAVSNLLQQSYHPPLYYVLASLFFTRGEKAVQLISLFFSIGALTIIYWLIKKLDFIQPLRIKRHSLLFACLLPQFVMFGNYISNDALSIFIGALIFFQMYAYINKPSMFNQNILAVYLGLGLLTKGTFLSFVPVFALLITLVNLRKNVALRKIIASLLIFISICLALGSYKYIENMLHFRRPVIHNLEAYFLEEGHTYQGLKSLYDVDIIKLCKHPVLSEQTKHSYPLMLYGSLWYQYIPESDFTGNKTVFRYLGSWIYIFALLPTLLFATGLLRVLSKIKRVFSNKDLNTPSFNTAAYESFSLLLLLSNLLLVITAGIKHDVWSCFQARLLFSCFFSTIILLNSGLNYIRSKYAFSEKLVYPLLGCLYLLFILYFGLEITGKLSGLPPELKT